MQEYALTFDQLSLTVDDLYAEMGYGKNSPEEPIEQLVKEMLNEVALWVEPRCTYGLFAGKIEDDCVVLNNGTRFEVGATIAKLMHSSYRFVLFAATAGKRFQQYQERLKEGGDILKMFLADIIGTCLAEKAGDQMELLLEQELAGERHTNRMSPGYCGWHLTGQKNLFAVMGGNPCGITLSEVCLMNPIKSISGVVGIGPEVNVKMYGCQFCTLDTCYKRKMRKK